MIDDGVDGFDIVQFLIQFCHIRRLDQSVGTERRQLF
jgi:hypothetical protein